MTHYKSDNLDNRQSISKHKPGDLTPHQLKQGDVRKKYPAILDSRTTVYLSHKPTEKEMLELKLRYKIT